MRDYSPGEIVINFWSNGKAPFHKLSNFAFISSGIEVDGEIYPSIEHAFQANKYIKEQRPRFSINGDLGSWDGIKLVVKDGEDEGKLKYWGKKNNIGYIAKMATSKKIGVKLGLIRDDNYRPTDELWIKLLTKKYSIKEFGDILKSTDDIYLLEFDNRARRNNSFWGGIIQNNTLYGNNQMGKYLMEIREITNNDK